MPNSTIVALGADATRDYAFPLPLTCLLWREKIGFNPVPFLVGDWSHPKNQVIADAFKHFGFEFHFVGQSDKYMTSTLAQNIREHAASIYTDLETWLMPGDADLWPFNRDFYQRHVGSNAKAISYYSNGDHFAGKQAVISAADSGQAFQTLPTCHVAMKVGTWQELYEYSSTNPLEATISTLDSWLRPKMEGKNPSDASWECWMSDQRILTEKVCRADWFPQSAILVERNGHPPTDRLDRCNMHDWSGDCGRWTDAHIVRAPDENWSLIRPIIAHHLPSYLAWAEDYRNNYLNQR